MFVQFYIYIFYLIFCQSIFQGILFARVAFWFGDFFVHILVVHNCILAISIFLRKQEKSVVAKRKNNKEKNINFILSKNRNSIKKIDSCVDILA